MRIFKFPVIFFFLVSSFAQVKTGEADPKLVTYQSMNLELAQLVAMETLKACRDEGYQVSVAVVNRSGGIQILVRDRLAGIFTVDIAKRKARTALNFHTDTINLVEPTKSGKVASGIRNFPDAMIVAGGVRIEAAGSIVGSIGVSGAPGPEIDDLCARKGIEKIDVFLNF
ncbi:MAG: hypothetical protein CMF71_04500 [Magnetovibrio sp.]|nr:hypothetical protein [Magnetovibrio sp.]|tara:strand:+ start:40 stop:549 length:510 start_codon:yes stop_codon:yes gene_type:complete